MKKHSIKILFSFLVITFYMGIISFVKVSSPKIQQSDWGEWINDDCFKGIDYRVKKVTTIVMQENGIGLYNSETDIITVLVTTIQSAN